MHAYIYICIYVYIYIIHMHMSTHANLATLDAKPCQGPPQKRAEHRTIRVFIIRIGFGGLRV